MVLFSLQLAMMKDKKKCVSKLVIDHRFLCELLQNLQIWYTLMYKLLN